MKSCFFFLCFLFARHSSTASGLGDWLATTPGGHYMGNRGGGTFLSVKSSSEEIIQIRKWYFFKGHIMAATDSAFFILDESKREPRWFLSKREWEQAIEEAGLEPALWTRWYTDNWRFFERMAIPLSLAGVFIFLPLLILAVWRLLNTSVQWIRSERKLKFRRIFIIGLLILLMLSIVRFFLDGHPQSF
jgi:hypothetical protein